jgi:hypothetical protein
MTTKIAYLPILEMYYIYELPIISELQHTCKLPTKLVWKQEIKKQIHNHWTKTKD